MPASDLNAYARAIEQLYDDRELYEEKRTACLSLQERFYDANNSYGAKLRVAIGIALSTHPRSENERNIQLASQAGSNSRTIRAAIVGTGYIADFHARAIRMLPDVELVAVCDVNHTSAKSFASNWEVTEAFSAFELMLQSGAIDFVHILVPPERHFSLTKIALEAGLHVLVEKPMCTSAAEANELVALAANKIGS